MMGRHLLAIVTSSILKAEGRGNTKWHWRGLLSVFSASVGGAGRSPGGSALGLPGEEPPEGHCPLLWLQPQLLPAGQWPSMLPMVLLAPRQTLGVWTVFPATGY